MADETDPPKKSPHDALIEALEHVEEMQDVVIIYGGKDDSKCGSFDSDLTVSESLYLVELFKAWIMLNMLKKET